MERILPRGINKIHFIGIGGIGMSGLANLLLDKGYRISGSDIKENSLIRKLRKRKVKINIPHSSSAVRGKDLICFSSAVSKDNPELKKAKALGIPVIRRGFLLGRILRKRKVLGISGSHGKTTTTSLASFVFKNMGEDIASLVGGIPHYSEDSSWWGKDLFIVETDESDGSFLEVKPTYSIITNIDREHLNFYKSFSNLKEAFLKFAKNTKEAVFGWADQKEVYQILKKCKKNFISYGFSSLSQLEAKDLRLSSEKSRFKVFYKNKFICWIETPLLGKHNVLNALSIIALCLYLGYDIGKIKTSLRDFPGTRRRLDFKGKYKGVIFIDDYAHHPKEIESTLEAVSLIKKKRLVVIFQPHRFSRVKNLSSEFSSSFKGIDLLIVTDIYPASEKPLPGIDADFLIKRIKKNFNPSQKSLGQSLRDECNFSLLGREPHPLSSGGSTKNILYIPKEALEGVVPFLLKRGDCLLSLGAGDINKIQERIIQNFRSQ